MVVAMKPESVARLRRIMRGEIALEDGVTGVSGVADAVGYASKPLELQRIRPLRLENGNPEHIGFAGVADGVGSPREQLEADIEERAGLASDRVPAVYLRAWAQLNHQRPGRASEPDWRQALDDGGRFLDTWGNEATELGWTTLELFDCPTGLIWRLAGERVSTIAFDHVRIGDGRILGRTTERGV